MVMRLDDIEQVNVRHPRRWWVGMRRVAHFTIAVALALLFASTGWTKAYGNYDARQLLVPASKPGAGGSLDLAYFDRMLSDLSEHAGSYPPQFDSPTDMQRAQRDAHHLIGMFDVAFGPSPPNGLLLRMGLLGSVGHNLDVPQAAAFAQANFQRLLRTNAEDAMGNYHYGSFLAASARPREALPYLHKARDKGVIPALYAIGMTQLSLGNKSSALSALNEYLKRNPSDQRVRMLADAIRDGKLDSKKEAKR